MLSNENSEAGYVLWEVGILYSVIKLDRFIVSR